MTSCIYKQIKEMVPYCPIMIADDDPSICALISAYLTNAGFQNVEIARDGIEVLNSIVKSQPACILLDIGMPLMDGNEVLEEIKSNPDTSDIPVIVITGNDNREVRNNILRLGASNLISKPINKTI